MIRQIGIANLATGPWIAGGAARAIYQGRDLTPSGDIDIFVRDPEQARAVRDAVRHAVKTNLEESNGQGTTNFLGTFLYNGQNKKVKIQVIGNTFFSDSPADLFKTFDFTVCQFVTDGRTILYTPEAEHDARKSVLRLAKTWVNPTRPSRIIRYFNYGFLPDATFLAEAVRLEERRIMKGLTIENAY